MPYFEASRYFYDQSESEKQSGMVYRKHVALLESDDLSTAEQHAKQSCFDLDWEPTQELSQAIGLMKQKHPIVEEVDVPF